MGEYAIKPLDAATWDAFVSLAEKHNGGWNGCWCMWFHPTSAEKGASAGTWEMMSTLPAALLP
jgi:hypothetical protein